MTVHCIKAEVGVTGTEPYETLETEVSDYLSDRNKVLTDEEAEFTLTEDFDGNKYFSGVWRFDWSEDSSTIEQDLVDRLDAVEEVDWYVVKYHECGHDGDGGACSWNEPKTGGTVPSWL